jgi:hypothetical protein
MEDLIIYGVGQLGALFARGALREGVRLTPIVRDSDPEAVFAESASDAPLLVAVGGSDLAGVLEGLPEERRARPILLQNELFPRKWRAHDVVDPTIVVFWSNKKEGRALERGVRTAIYGPHAELMLRIQRRLDVPALELDSRDDLLDELVAKYAFILTINALGLVEDRSVGAWYRESPETVDAILDDAIALGEAHAEHDCDRTAVVPLVHRAFEALADMPARGRSAQRRVTQAWSDADHFDLELTSFDEVGLSDAPEM